jgi:5-methylcytosine-specific restriction protein B
MQIGDIVVVTNGNLRFRAIGRVTGDYQPPRSKTSKAGPESVDHWQTRTVSWLWQATDDGLAYADLSSKRFSQQTIYELRYAEIDVPTMRKLIAGGSAVPTQNHVMIIDEINRGNVARILGELITCIEPQRRLDQDEETRVQLTYSQLHFGVPANLYLIGTMNTADRSIAFLDSALRRRFRFVAVSPEPELLADIEIDGVEVDALVRTINDRLAVLLDEDHQLGHAYFLRVATADDLRRVLADQIVPLLREQFHGDDQRLCLALGCAYDPESGAQTNAHPILKADTINLGAQESPRMRVRINPLFLKATGPDLTAFLASIVGPG